VPGLDEIRSALLGVAASGEHLEHGAVVTYLEEHGLKDVMTKFLGELALKSDWFAWPEAALSDALTGFEHLVKRFQHITAARRAYEQAEKEYASDMTDENHARFVAAQEAYRELEEKESEKEGYRLESGRFSFS
jgi:DNA primase